VSDLARVFLATEGCVPVAHVQGEIDLSNADEILLQAGLEVAVRGEGVPALVLDLTGVSYIDSAGIRALLELSERLSAQGRSMRVVVGEEASIARVLELAGVPELLALAPTVEAAVVELGSGSAA
jgi:anti-sigma B factor antagonist